MTKPSSSKDSAKAEADYTRFMAEIYPKLTPTAKERFEALAAFGRSFAIEPQLDARKAVVWAVYRDIFDLKDCAGISVPDPVTYWSNALAQLNDQYVFDALNQYRRMQGEKALDVHWERENPSEGPKVFECPANPKRARHAPQK